MRTATLAEYNRVTATAGADKRFMESRRSQTIVWSLCGVVIAEKTRIFKRGGEVSATYQINEKFLGTVV